MILAVFVDDVTSCFSPADRQEWLEYKQIIKTKYEITDLGRIHHLLGMKIKYENETLLIEQQQYVVDKLDAFGLANCTSVSTPESQEKISSTQEGDMVTDLTKYRSLLGAALYLAHVTRVDIMHAVHKLSRFMHAPNQSHMTAATRIYRYLKDAKNYGLVYKNHTNEKSITITYWLL